MEKVSMDMSSLGSRVSIMAQCGGLVIKEGISTKTGNPYKLMHINMNWMGRHLKIRVRKGDESRMDKGKYYLIEGEVASGGDYDDDLELFDEVIKEVVFGNLKKA